MAGSGSVVKINLGRCAGWMLAIGTAAAGGEPTPDSAMPPGARVVFEEDWSTGRIDPNKWYLLQKKWGEGNHGVVRQNVFIGRDSVRGKDRPVLICRGHGDRYDGAVAGWQGRKERVGGVIVSKPFFASGRFDVVMKIGRRTPGTQGPADPTHPIGMVPAIWTYGYRWVGAEPADKSKFSRKNPLYNPLLDVHGWGSNEYWSELDFPEFGKNQNFKMGLYNAFLNRNQQSRTFSTEAAIDGQYHTFTTLWRTQLIPLDGVSDNQVASFGGYWWIQDEQIPFARYRGNPLKRVGRDRYAVYAGKEAVHFIDGRFVGANPTFVPAMAAQLNIGVWFPDWAGAAPWAESSISVASVKVWQFGDPGDVRGILTDNISDNMDAQGAPVEPRGKTP